MDEEHKKQPDIYISYSLNEADEFLIKQVLSKSPHQSWLNVFRDPVFETREVLPAALEELILNIRKGKALKLEIAPGFKMLNFLSSICPKAFRERELDALHADSIELYFEKLRAGDKWGAKRVAIAMRFWMLWTVVGGVVTGVFSMIRGKQKSSE